MNGMTIHTNVHILSHSPPIHRKIFQRMRNYATYACTTTIRIVLTFSVLAMAFEFSFQPFLILIIAFLNDGTVIAISKDKATPSKLPDTWNLYGIYAMSIVSSLYHSVSIQT